MANQAPNHLKVRSLVYLGLCVAGVAGFLLIAVIPNYLAIKNLQQDTKQTRTRIARQEVLYPFYQQMLHKLQNLESRSMALPFPDRTGLAREDLGRIERDFSQAARQAGIELKTVPDLSSLTRSSRTLVVNSSGRGNFFSFRNFLVGLGRLPYLQKMEKIEIQAMPEEVRFKIKCRLALE